MAYELKTNTATRIAVGPLVDPTDGKTAETALTVTALAVEIFQLKTDGTAVVRAAFNPTASGGSNDMVHVTDDTTGMYDLELTAAQLNFLGNARLAFYDVDGFLVHWIDIQVVSAAYFDWKYGTTALQVTLADDAITASKFDETTAFPITVADAGETYIARTGADSDTLETLSDEIDASGVILSAIKAKTDNLPSAIPKNVAFPDFTFVMFSSQNHVTPQTGLSVDGKISKDGAAFADLSGSVTAIGYGYYKVDLTQAEMNADVVALRFTATGADAAHFTIKTDS